MDFFRLQIRSPGALTVYTTGSTDTLGVLTGPDGFTDRRDDNSGSESNFSIEAPVSEGVYFVQVRPGSSLVTGGYILHVAFSEGAEDDHGGTEQTATEIAVPSATQGEPTTTQGEIRSGDDVDYFRLQIRSTGALTVYTTGSTDTLGVLTGPDGFTDRRDDDSGSESNFSIEAPVSEGVYFVQVRLGSSLVTGGYTLNVQFSEGAEDEHGDTKETATEIAVPSTTQGRIHSVWNLSANLEEGGDRDFFRFELRSPGTLAVYTTGSIQTGGTLENPEGVEVVLFGESGSLNFRTDFFALPGTYYVSVASPELGEYVLHVEFSEDDPGGAGQGDDHGNSKQTATEIRLPSTTPGEIHPGDDVDYFRLQVRSSGTLTVYTTGSTDTRGLLTGPSGFGDRRDDDSGSLFNFRIAAVVSPGIYYVRVNSYGSSSGAYTMEARFSEGDPGGTGQGDDHGNTEQTATEIRLPSTTPGEIHPGDDVDYFRLQVRSSGTLTVYTTGSTDTRGLLTGPSGFGDRRDDDSGSLFNFRIAAVVSPGIYHVRVNSYGSSSGAYAMEARFSESVAPDDRFNRRFWDQIAFDAHDCPGEGSCPDYYTDGSASFALEERVLHVLPFTSPSFHIRTHNDDGERRLSAAEAGAIRREIAGAVEQLTGEAFRGDITSGSHDVRRERWITIRASSEEDDPDLWETDDPEHFACGSAYVGALTGSIWLNSDRISTVARRNKCLLAPLVIHEIGHAMGFFHVSGRRDVMAVLQDSSLDSFTSREQYHAQLAYELGRNTRYTDGPLDAPTTMASRRRDGGSSRKRPEVRCFGR